jgi:DNA topoisomerase 2-associated protein PAT1
MAFFGFDTTLPRDRDGTGTKGFFENPDPFADIARANALGDDDV